MRIRWIIPFAAGAAVMWFCDPELGHRRRVVARDKLQSRARRVEREVESAARYEAGVIAGEEARAHGGGRYHEHGYVDLREHLKGEIHRLGLSDVNVEADEDGRVTLRGQVDGDHHEAMLLAVALTDGVKEIVDYTHRPGEVAPNKAAAIAASDLAARKN